MYINRGYFNVNDALADLSSIVLSNGTSFDSRNGATQDLNFVGVTLTNPEHREITLPSRKHNLAAQIAETMWVISGRDDIEWLERYLPRARDFSDDGVVWRGAYGRRIRRWPRRNGNSHDVIDQLAHVVRLFQADPNSRRAVIAIYDPQVDCADGKDIPCNDFLTFSIRNGRLDVGVTIRSNDLMWGWSGVNAFEWSALQEILAGLLGVKIGALHFSITSLHLYEQHWEKARKLRNEVHRPAAESPRFTLDDAHRNIDSLDLLIAKWFDIEYAIRNGDSTVPDRVENFPEPMLRSWLRVLQWWWTGDKSYLEPITGSRLEVSAGLAMQPPKREIEWASADLKNQFVSYVTDLHTQKHEAYGDSWKRRGEMLGIMANIARKIDRLGSNSTTADESAADTAIDLLVYLAKYRWWLTEKAGAPSPASVPYPEGGDPGSTNNLIRSLGKRLDPNGAAVTQILEKELTQRFDYLETCVTNQGPERWRVVDEMMVRAFFLAHQLWTAEQK